MIAREELIKTEEYWLEIIQNDIFRMVTEYIEKEGINQTKLAEKLGVTKGYVSQVMNGNFNFTLKKLIELSLATGKAPVIEFKPLDTLITDKGKNKPLNLNFESKVADPETKYGE